MCAGRAHKRGCPHALQYIQWACWQARKVAAAAERERQAAQDTVANQADALRVALQERKDATTAANYLEVRKALNGVAVPLQLLWAGAA